jgi:hypothetical protein
MEEFDSEFDSEYDKDISFHGPTKGTPAALALEGLVIIKQNTLI